jgi:outer membrane receptor for monomeric catechols
MKKLFLLLSLIFISGCGTAALMVVGPAIEGVVKWEQGEAHKYYSYDSAILYRATKRALISLNIPISKDQPANSRNGKVFYITAEGKSQYKIKISPEDNNITDVGLRVNFMGNHPQAELIYQKIDLEINTIKYDAEGEPF